jgi:hypothetical protein
MAETTIASRQIRDGAITNAKIVAGAGIETTKLQHGTSFLKKEGDVAMLGNLDFNNNKATNLGTPTSNGDAANKIYVDNLIAALPSAYKYRNVHVASVANINLSNPGTASFDGHTLATGDRILAKDQTTASQNGIYVFDTSSTALTRATDSDAWDELVGTLVYVDQGTVNADARFFCTSNTGGTLGSTAVVYVQDTSGTLNATNFVIEEIPTGAINGVNVNYSLAYTPTAGTVKVYLNGLRQRSGAGNDFTISTNIITFITPPIAGDVISCDYMK